MIDNDDTIAALSTAPGAAGVAVIKLSGPTALESAQAVFKPNVPGDWTARKMILGRVVDPEGRLLDTALAVHMPAPNSYTRQDVVEIQTHGGSAVSATVLDLLADRGVRMAQPGEFTRRAFLSGRLDLAQAEAVLDVIAAGTKAALTVAGTQLAGALSAKVGMWREWLIDARALLEANIDFPDEEIGSLDVTGVQNAVANVTEAAEKLLSTYAAGRLYREGALCVIAGRPNVGKSSLLNKLLDKKRAIVTEVPGTTRDSVEDQANIEGLPFRLVDTAGIRKAEDPIENEGVAMTREQIAAADLVLFMCEASKGITEADRAIETELSDRNVIRLVNKIDLVDKTAGAKLAEALGPGALCISALSGDGLDRLRQAMVAAVRGESQIPSDEVILTNARHRQAILKGVEFLNRAHSGLNESVSPELVAQDLSDAMDALGEILGETVPDDLLEVIFSRFCIGK
jgi:tRNA modification GTPase